MSPIDGCNPEIYGHLCFVPDRPDRLGTRCTTPDGYPYTTSYATCPEPIATVAQPKQIHRLPETGLDGSLAPIGLGLVVVGALLRRAVR